MKRERSDRHGLRGRVALWAKRLKVAPKVVRVQRMTKKWGSCSAAGTVTLASELISRPADFQDFVIVHELLHLRIPNHGRLFKATMTAHLPNWKSQNLSRHHNGVG